MAENQTVATFITQSEKFFEGRHVFYQPLNPDRREIRLVHIQPGQYEDAIHLELSTVDLSDNPFYETISYTWEAMSPVKQVFVHGLEYNVTVNQHAALRRLRLPDRTKILWMDVICIDQANLEERGHQVSIMGDVYTNAVHTDVWLGEMDEDWYKIMDDEEWEKTVAEFEENRTMSSFFSISQSDQREKLMSEFLQIDDSLKRATFILHQLAADVHLGDFPYCTFAEANLILCRKWYESVRTLLKILQRPWWTRVWVLQEVFLCKGDPKVLLGSLELPFSLFIRAIEGLHKHVVLDQCCMQTFGPAFLPLEVLDRLFDLGSLSIIPKLNKSGEMPLNKAIQLTQHRNATDIRDYVYGVLGLVEPEDRVKVDYTLTVRQVFASTSWYILKARNTLTWLVLGALPNEGRTPDIPTWSVDWIEVDRLAFRYNDSWEMDEVPDWNRMKYDEDLELVANHITEIRHVLKNLQHDEKLTDCQNHHMRLWSWIEELRKNGFDLVTTRWTADDYQVDEKFDEFFATILRDTISTMEASDVQNRRLNAEDWQAVFEWWILLNKCKEEGTEQAYPGVELFTIANMYTLNSKDYTLALTIGNKLCLVPEAAKAGDLLYHIRACCPPMVLREVDAGIFQVVGPAYLRDSMGSAGWAKDDEHVITLA